MTPLHYAAKNGFKTLVTSLVSEHGALLDAMTLVINHEFLRINKLIDFFSRQNKLLCILLLKMENMML